MSKMAGVIFNVAKVVAQAGFALALALLGSGCAGEGKLAARSDNPQTCGDVCMAHYRRCIQNCPDPDENLRCTGSCQKGYDGCSSRCLENRPCC
jgi:hypothetical protein